MADESTTSNGPSEVFVDSVNIGNNQGGLRSDDSIDPNDEIVQLENSK